MKKHKSELIEKWKERPISWSQLGSWKYSKDQWLNKYILGLDDGGNEGMRFGNVVGDTLGLDTSLVPKLNPHLVGIKEYEMKTKMNNYVLIGYADHFCPTSKILNENKTSQKLNRWTQAEVDHHGQLTMYALMLLLQDKIQPHDIKMYLNFIPVVEGGDFQLRVLDPDKFHRFETKRTLKQVLDFGADIDKTVKTMEKYVLSIDIPA
jgi:hypothetical protein